MNDVIQQINLYNNLFKICLVLALIFLVVAITVFFMLDIKFTIGYLTGRRAKKQIKELEAANAASGRLMSKGKSMQYVDQKMKSDMGVRQAATPGIRKVEHAVEHVAEPVAEQTMAQQPVQQEVQQPATKKSLRKRKNEPVSQDTQVLTMPDMDATQLLQSNENGAWDTNNTTVLTGKMSASYMEEPSTAVLDEKVSQMGRFLIIRELILIHTEEVI